MKTSEAGPGGGSCGERVKERRNHVCTETQEAEESILCAVRARA